MKQGLARLAPVVPPETLERYERWVAEQPAAESYLFDDVRVRFEPRADDVVVPRPGLSTEAHSEGCRLTGPGFELAIPGVSKSRADGFLSELDGERTLREAAARAGLDRKAERVLGARAFGIALFAPLAIAELERRAPASEIVRFPGSPYEIVRSYWQNAGAARLALARLEARVEDPPAALDELRRLHAVLLLGEDGNSFYRPASPISNKGVFPGSLYPTAPRLVPSAAGLTFAEGPRVNASWLGGFNYWALLGELAGDPDATTDRRHEDEHGLEWGQVATARAAGDPGFAPWFCPPRPITLAHFASVFSSFELACRARDAADRPAAVRELGLVHQKLVRLHPFRAANQALAMTLVNGVLAACRGPGIPHLLLDQLALRLRPEAYQRVFALAVAQYSVSGTPAEKLRAFAEKKRQAYALVSRLERAESLEDARRLVRSSPDQARLAQLCV